MFISFEGPEGSGKTTQIERLHQRLSQAGKEVVVLREPGGTKLGEAIRDLLKNSDMAPEAELLLFAASRAQLVREAAVPALQAGHVVLCDRFLDSTNVYQGAARQIEARALARINAFAVGVTMPDLTIVLDVPLDEGLRRVRDRGEPDRFEREDEDFHQRVREGYRALADEEPERVKLLDGTASPEWIEERIWQLVHEHLD
jgi:dTMP kinase